MAASVASKMMTACYSPPFFSNRSAMSCEHMLMFEISRFSFLKTLDPNLSKTLLWLLIFR